MQNLQDIIQQKVINEMNTQREKPIKNLVIQFKSNSNWKSSSDLSDVNVIRQSQGIQSVPVTRNRQVEMELKIRSSQFMDKLDAKEIWKRRKDYQNKVKQFHLPKIKEYKRNFSILEKKDEQSQMFIELLFLYFLKVFPIIISLMDDQIKRQKF